MGLPTLRICSEAMTRGGEWQGVNWGPVLSVDNDGDHGDGDGGDVVNVVDIDHDFDNYGKVVAVDDHDDDENGDDQVDDDDDDDGQV